MKVNGKSKTPITAAQSKKNSGEASGPSSGKPAGTRARTSKKTSKSKISGVQSAVLARISDGILAFDARLNYTYLNERAGELLGRSAKDLVGRNLREEYPGRTPFMEACQRALETQSVVWLNEYFPPTDRWLEGRVYPSKDGVSVLFREGTRQKAVEDELTQELSTIPQQNPAPVLRLTPNGEILYANPASASLLAEWKEQGEQAPSLVQIRAILPEVLNSSSSRDIEIEHQGKIFLCLFAPVQERGYVNLYFRDITERKQAEDRIREISMFPEQNPNPVMRLTRDGEVLYANPASVSLLAEWKEQREQAASYRRIHGLLSDAIHSGAAREVEIENQGRVLNGLLVPFPREGYVNLYFRDITGRKQAEEALRSLIDQASAGIARTDTQGRFIFANETLCEMLGYSEADLTGMTIWDITEEDMLEKSKLLFEQLLAGGEGYQLEKRVVRHNGTRMWVSAGVSPVRDADGRIRGATAVILDITRRKRAEESLLDSARRSLFLSSLSDTIRAISDPVKVQTEAACLLGAHLGASRVVYMEMQPDGMALVRGSYVNEAPEMTGRCPIDAIVPRALLAKLHGGRPVIVSDIQNDSRFSKSQRSAHEALSIQAQIVVPFTRDGQAVAALCIQQSQPRVWKEEELSLLEESADRIWSAFERAQAEEKLRDSERRFRILSNTVPSIVWSSAPDGTILYVNDQWYDYTGLPREGKHLWSDLVIHPDDYERAMREISSIKSGLGESVLEARIRRHDGVYRWFQTRSVPTMDENGNITAWHGVTTDIHERVEKEEELRQIIDNTPFSLVRSSRDLRYRFVSRAAAELLGGRPEEIEGRPLAEILGESTLNNIRPYIESVLQGEQVQYENTLHRPGKDPIILQAYYVPDIDEHGDVTGWFASLVDITERKQAEEARRESEHKFTTIYSKLPFTAALLRPEDGVVVDVNEEFQEVFGYTPQEAVGRTLFDLGIDPKMEDRVRILAELQTSVSVRNMELELLTKQHGPRTFLINSDLVTIGGQQFILQTAQDITERKQVEQDLARERELLNRIFESIPVMLTVYDPNVKMLRLNAEFERLLGWTSREAGSISIMEACYPDPGYREHVRLFMDSCQPGEWMDIRMTTREGGTLETSWSNIRLSSQLQVGIGIDITERKRAADALRNSEERMRLAIEANRMVTWEWDVAADRVTASDNMAEIYGLPAVKTAAEGFSLIRPEDLPAHREKVDRVIDQGGEYRSEFRITRPVDGRTAWLEERATAMTGADGRVARLIGVVTDITERKRTEKDLAEYARQQEALFQLADRLQSADSSEKTFEPALDAIISALQCSRASILLFDSQKVMRFVAWRGLSDTYRRATDGHTPWKHDEKDAEPICIGEIGASDLSDSLKAVIRAEGIGALAFIPLVSNETLIGKFMVYFDQPHEFGEADIELSQTIAHQLASNIERIRAGEDLRRSQQRLSLTYHHALMGIVEGTLDGHFIQVNDEFCKMLGYPYEELIQLSLADVTHRDDIAGELELYGRLVAGEIEFYRLEKRYVRKDGDFIWGEVVWSIARDENGRPLYAVGGILDVTLRRQREEELRARTEEIEMLMAVSPIGIMVAHDPECNHITGNPAANAILGLPMDSRENLSNPALAVKGPAHRVFRNGVELAVQDLPMQVSARLGVEVEDEILEVRFEDGTNKYIYLFAKPLFDVHGRSRGTVAALLDITERKRNEEALRRSEERFARFMHHLPGLAWIKDMQGRYIFANTAAQKAFNRSQEQLYGKTDSEIFPAEVAAQFKHNDDQALLEEKGLQVVETMPQKDGIVHHSLVTKFTIPGPNGQPELIGGTAFDITDRIQMEDALQRARRQAEETAYRMTQLQSVTAALSEALTPQRVAQVVVDQGAPAFGAVTSSILLASEDGQWLEMMYSTAAESLIRPYRSFPLSMNVPSADAARSGKPVWIESQQQYLEKYPHLAEQISQWGHEAALAIPMQYEGRILGVLTLSFDKVVPYTLEDEEYALTLARQGAQALERARAETALRLDAMIMENVSAGIYLVRASDGVILHTNPRFDSLFGYQPGEVLGRHVSIINAPTDHSPQEVAAGIINHIKARGSWQGEVLSIRKDATTFWCYASITTYEHPIYGTVWVAARQDITAQKQVEEALRESEQRYRAIVSQATAGIVRKDSGGRLLYVNQAFCSLIGYSESELLGRPIWDLTHKEDAGENKRLYRRLISEGIPFELEKRLIHRNGSILWVNVSVSPVLNAGGRTHSAVSVYVDVTRRRQAENRLSLLAEISELTRKFDDPDELIHAVSRMVGEHFQVSRCMFEEVDLGQYREIIHRDYHRGLESVAGVHAISEQSSLSLKEMMAGKTVVNSDAMIDPRTAQDYDSFYAGYGIRAYVSVPLMREERWVASLLVSDDAPRGWTLEDVSLLETIAERTWIAIEKLRVDQALRDSEERLRVTFNTTAVGFATLTPDTRFMDVNDAFCGIVGYLREELLEMTYDRLIHPEYDEKTSEQISLLISGTIPSFSIEKIFVRRDGTEIWVQNSLSIVRDAAGNPSHLIVICQDVTERQRSEKALQESNQRYQTLVEISPYAILVTKDSRIVFANNECLKMIGAETPEQLLGKSNYEILHPDYHEIVKERVRHMMDRHENVIPLEEKIIRLDGQIVDVEIAASPFIEKGEPAILVTMNDITERKRAEDALHQLNLELEERVRKRTVELQAANEFLRESEATARLILESMPDAIVIIDQDGEIVHANRQVETLFGYTPGEVMGRPVETLVPPRFHEQHAQHRSSYKDQRNRRIMGLGQELYGKRKDESEFPVEVMLAPIDNSTNWDVLVAIRDNTKQRQAQEALRSNEEKLRTLFGILPVGISFLDKEGKINDLNSALAEILGLSRTEILTGKYKAHRYIRADGTAMPPSEFASTRARVEQKTIYNVETGIVRDSGEITWTSVNAAPVQVADVQTVVVTVDITERKQAEEALHRHRERLKVLSRRLVEVQEEERHAIARELHDRVGQNLAALTLNLNILRNQLSSEVLDKVGTRLNDSVTLVKEVLTITRSVMADLRPNVLDDYGLDAALNEYAERFTQRYGIRVTTHTPAVSTPRLDPGVEMTLLRIAQEALTNIARHAQATQAVMSLEMEGDAILMMIEDNGLGILSWQKVNQPGSHGLRIMRERAEAFGGYLKIHSTYKNGTKIEVKIPLTGSVPVKGSKEKKS